MMQAIFILIASVAGISAQFFPQQDISFALQPPPLQQQRFVVPQQQFVAPQQQFVAPQQQFQQFARQQQIAVPSQQNYAHRAVVENAARESQLPPQLLNPFYKNQRVAAALAKESWFAPGENLVIDREAEKIPRQKIYSVLKNAGFVNRRR